MTRYGLTFKDYDDLQIEMFMIQSGGKWTDQKTGMSFGMGFYWHYERMRQIIWPHLDNHRWHKLCRNQILKNKVTVLMGPGSCVAGETLIDGVAISELSANGVRPIVMTLNGPELAHVPYFKGRQELFEVTMESGNKFTSTAEHLVLSAGGFVPVFSLQPRKSLLLSSESHPASTSAPVREWSLQDALRLSKIVQGSRYDYQQHPYSYDAQLLLEGDGDQCGVPSQDDAPKYTRHQISCRVLRPGVREHEQAHTHHGQQFSHLSNRHAVPLGLNNRSVEQYRSVSKNERGDDGLFSPTMQSSIKTHHLAPSLELHRDSSRIDLDFGMPFQNNRVQADAVQSIKSVGVQDFYDLEVPKAHHYFAGGAIHHNSGKTHEAAWIYLCEYFCFPQETAVLVSSTDMRGLRLRVWGEITDLWQQARDRFDYLPGNLIDSRVAITTDRLDDKEVSEERRVRDMRKGIVGIPTVQGSKNVGLQKWQGIKQKRVRLIADEAALMNASFLSAFSNLNKNEDFRAVVIGNPSDTTDPLGMAAEPIDGWGTQMETAKTTVWQTRFMGGVCVNLIGTDSPNFDPQTRNKFKYLINEQKIKETLSFFPKESPEYYSQCVGSMKISIMARRVITRQMCRQFGALGMPLWMGTERTKIAGLDAAYGGDRCVFGIAEFGLDNDGKQVLCIHPQEIVPVIVGKEEPEDQISRWVKHKCEDNNILPENFFHDSTGRGSLGTALARHWSAACNPVEFGGKPTTRPVSLDFFIYDEEDQQRRLKLSCEHHYNFITELWFAIRYTIESGQMRSLPEDIMDECCKRQWDWVARGGSKVIQVEPKEDMKLRTRQSPDQADCLAICVEGARRRGFQITKMAKETDSSDLDNWLAEMSEEQDTILQSHMLVHR